MLTFAGYEQSDNEKKGCCGGSFVAVATGSDGTIEVEPALPAIYRPV